MGLDPLEVAAGICQAQRDMGNATTSDPARRPHPRTSSGPEPTPAPAPDIAVAAGRESGRAPEALTQPETSEFRVDGVDVHLDADGNPRMVERRFVVEKEYAGWRVDHFLKRQIPRLSRTKLQGIIRTQLLPVRGRKLKPHSAVATGDVVVIRHPARPEPPCPRTFSVLYRDPHMMVIDKPAGLPVHSSAKFFFNTLTRVLRERYPDENVQICHRLDRETSGCLVVARGRGPAARLKGAFADHTVQKAYLAIVHGDPPWPDGALPTGREAEDQGAEHVAEHGTEHVIDLPLALADSPLNIRMEVRAGARPARTRVRVVERRADYAMVCCMPVTGRQHQIRAHLAAVGYPIVGDKLYTHGERAFMEYCDRGMTSELLARFELPRQALHAAVITVPHPDTRADVRVACPLPTDMREFLAHAHAADPTSGRL